MFKCLNGFSNILNMYNIFQLSSEVSGRDAKTKVRGRLKDREEEERMKKEKADTVRKEVEAKYAKWNRG